MNDDNMAAYYYLKADQQACLTKSGAKWLLNYLRNGGDLHLSTTDLARLQILADEKLVVETDAFVIE